MKDQAFWDVLRTELSEDPPVYNQTLNVLTEIRDTMLGMTSQNQVKDAITERLDAELIAQQAENRVLDVKELGLFIIDLLGKLCDPVRDEEVANLRTHLDNLVELFKEIMKVLDHMKLDIEAKSGSSKDEKSENSSKAIEIRNLTKDFSQEELIRLLRRTGNFSMNRGILIDKIKSQALVMFESAAEAEETVMALDGAKWPSSNQKKLIVTFTSDNHFVRHLEASMLKVIICGSEGVGKSALIERFLFDKFIEVHSSTIARCVTKDLTIVGQKIKLGFLDFAGQKDYFLSHPIILEGSDGFVTMFSLTDQESFQATQEFREQILRVKKDDTIPFILVGNKSDLTDQRTVPRQNAQAQSDDWKVPYVETSAKTREGLDIAFSELVKKMTKKRKNFQCEECDKKNDILNVIENKEEVKKNMVVNPFFQPKKPKLNTPQVPPNQPKNKKKNRNGSFKKKIREAKKKAQESKKSEKSEKFENPEKSGKIIMNNIESVNQGGIVYLVSSAKDIELLKKSQTSQR